MTAKIIPFRRQELERTRYGRRHLTPEQREHRREMSRRPRRSKNGTPEERAIKAAQAQGASAEEARREYRAAELRALYDQLTPEQRIGANRVMNWLRDNASTSTPTLDQGT